MGDLYSNGAKTHAELNHDRIVRLLGNGWKIVSQEGGFTIMEPPTQPNQTEDEPNETPNKQS